MARSILTAEVTDLVESVSELRALLEEVGAAVPRSLMARIEKILNGPTGVDIVSGEDLVFEFVPSAELLSVLATLRALR